jgi:hypothetical protein
MAQNAWFCVLSVGKDAEGSITLSLPQGKSGTVTESVRIWRPSRN